MPFLTSKTPTVIPFVKPISVKGVEPDKRERTKQRLGASTWPETHQTTVGNTRPITFEEALQDVVTLAHHNRLVLVDNLKLEHDQWRKDKARVDQALERWNAICRLDAKAWKTPPRFSFNVMHKIVEAVVAVHAIQEHPYTQVRDNYEISYDLWLYVAQFQHLKIVERALNVPVGWPGTSGSGTIYNRHQVARTVQEPKARLSLDRLVDLTYPKHLKTLEKQLDALEKLLQKKVVAAQSAQPAPTL